MPEDVKTDEELETEATPELAHDDIVKRLLDYQRQLREGAPDESTSGPAMSSPPTDEMIDLTAEEEAALVASAEVTSNEAIVDAALDAPAEVADVIDITTGRAAEGDAPAAVADPSVPEMADPEMSEAPAEPAADTNGVPAEVSAATQALEERIAGMERSLERLSSKFAELRSSFQDMAIAADERLADIEDIVTQLRTP